MKKSKLIGAFAILMAILNIGLMFFIWSHKRPPHPPLGGPKMMVIEKLELDDNQISAYDELIVVHKKSIQEEQAKIHDLKNKLYQTLIVESQLAKDSIMKELANQQTVIENIHYNHFLDLKALCRPEQLDNFNSFVGEISKLFGQKPPMKKKQV